MEGKPETCTREELPDLIRLANAVFRASGGDMRAEYPLLFSEENLAHCHIIKEEGRIVSHVGALLRDARVLGCHLRVAAIGAVCTEPASRGKGYASRLVEEARQSAAAEGACLMLISGGRGLYHRLGFVNVGAFQSLRVSRACLTPVREHLRLSACGTGEVPALVGLYQSLPVRFVRPPEDWEKLLSAGMLMDRPAECLGVWEQERLVAYAGVQMPNPQGRPAVPRVLEYAGSETALFESLVAIADRYHAEAVEVVAMPAAYDLVRLLLVAGAEQRQIAFPGTLGIIHPTRFLEAIRPYLLERLGSVANSLAAHPLESGGVRFRLGDSDYCLETMGQLTALVFGGSTEEARAVPPPPEPMVPLLRQVFPMPLLWYGYNYV